MHRTRAPGQEDPRRVASAVPPPHVHRTRTHPCRPTVASVRMARRTHESVIRVRPEHRARPPKIMRRMRPVLGRIRLMILKPGLARRPAATRSRLSVETSSGLHLFTGIPDLDWEEGASEASASAEPTVPRDLSHAARTATDHGGTAAPPTPTVPRAVPGRFLTLTTNHGERRVSRPCVSRGPRRARRGTPRW